MAKGQCNNCGHRPTNLLMLKGTTSYYQCNSCKRNFCTNCKKGSHTCPNCGSSNTKKIGQLGDKY